MTFLPIEWIGFTIEELEELPELRWLLCPKYEDCLGVAAGFDWEGWTCLYCSFQKKNRNVFVSKEKPNDNGF